MVKVAMTKSQYKILSLLLLFLVTAAHAQQTAQLKSINDFPIKKLSTNVYIIHGPQKFPSQAYQGFNNNPAFIVSKKGIIVIDPGGNIHIGRDLITKIQTISKQPIVAVFNTHIHGDHWLANQAIKEKYPQVEIYAHEKMIEQIQKGAGKDWIDIMNRITKNASQGTKPVSPTKGLKGGETLRFGEISLRIHHPQLAHTDTDIMIEVMPDKVFFFGDIVTRQQLATARPKDGDLKGQIKAIEIALKTQNRIFVPGHGQSGSKTYVKNYHEFLKKLHGLIKFYFDQGLQDYEMKPKIIKSLQKYKNWLHFDDIGRIINHEFVTLENNSI